MKNEYYVYKWFNTETNEVFYIGKGKGYRYKNITQRNKYFKNYFNKYSCSVEKVKEHLTEQEAFNLEKELILKYKKIGQAKCNLSEGGEGCSFPKGTWNHMFRKLQYLHDVACDMDDMLTEMEYDPSILKEKSLEELNNLYNEYRNYKENLKFLKENNLIDSINEFELKTKDKEIFILTNLLASLIAQRNNHYKNYFLCKTEFDYLCCDFNLNKFLNKILGNSDYLMELSKTCLYTLKVLKNMSIINKKHFPLILKSYTIKNNFIYLKIRLNNKNERMKIDLRDVILNILIYKNTTLSQILYKEICAASFI